MSEREQEHDQHAALRVLREEVAHLVKTVPGPVAAVSLRLGDCALEVTWASAATAAQVVAAPAVPAQAPAAAEEAVEDPALTAVTAPLVGTFYHAPEPGAAPYVRVGDRVRAGQTVGVVEAMKLMNQVVAEQEGEVVEVVAGNAEPVEYGQALVRIRVGSA
ncbi:acetyl-CoA carboxylase biotin carboxyl carrier protein [Nonomuraea dietziae]|uniref:Biotin carboxyl carrier protein of acetyl-CoA carboxylase n=1 Tax=Nonomuraea dietziae TaxID=65515 RepID=A0A7W5V6I1_9ACTN|nr:acetyl-CoA carboxylase biotin carboxyl carrier protein [Nonomuraea dietziae]MBB3728861.1 acetyl-CoA carboxylase biotin carboxyl carrier protein [Nonomuraea dietziae]